MYSLMSQGNSNMNIDCIKKCPHNQTIFAFAFYQQHPQFVGGIAIKNLQNENYLIHDLQIYQYGPILHICWLPKIHSNHCYIIVAACRSQKIIVFMYDPILHTINFIHEVQIAINQFCLYLDAVNLTADSYNIIVSTNQSTVFALELDHQFKIKENIHHKKHEYAVWTCRYNPYNINQFACGDQVNSIYLYQNNICIGKNNNSHQQGICDLVFLSQYSLLSGGFDGIVCQFDTRYFTKGFVHKNSYGGTIWRIIPDSKQQNLLLCNSSEKKFQVIEKNSAKEKWNSEKMHDSLAYAADWNDKSLITASFYDKKVCFWEINKKEQN